MLLILKNNNNNNNIIGLFLSHIFQNFFSDYIKVYKFIIIIYNLYC